MNENEALRLIIEERIRQTLVEGYTLAHDDEHTEGQMALLAAAYTLSSRDEGFASSKKSMMMQQLENSLLFYNWPFKPADSIRDLVRSGALVLAELERRLRLSG